VTVLIGPAGYYLDDQPCRRCRHFETCTCRAETSQAPAPDEPQDLDIYYPAAVAGA